jgi:hypothetical protein
MSAKNRHVVINASLQQEADTHSSPVILAKIKKIGAPMRNFSNIVRAFQNSKAALRTSAT